jgi:hypothetical protein
LFLTYCYMGHLCPGQNQCEYVKKCFQLTLKKRL